MGYVAVCPVLRGCISQGRTKRAAIKNIREAIDAYIEALIKDGLPVPTERAVRRSRSKSGLDEQLRR